MDARELVAWNMRRLRVRQGLSQEVLAADAGIDRAYVSRIERGLENPTIGILEQMAAVLNAEMIEFFLVPEAGEERPQPLRAGRRGKTTSRG